MDLKSGTLYWPSRTQRRPRGRALRRNIHCDVVVIGAGLTGAMIAQALSRGGLDVIILDKRQVGRGSTSASTALVLYEVDTPLVELARRRGWKDAAASYRRCLTAINELESLVSELGDPCGFCRRPSLYLASKPRHVQSLRREFAARKRAGIELAFLGPEEIEKRYSFSAPAGLYSLAAAELDPFRLASFLVKSAVQSGARLFVRAEATHILGVRHGVTVTTSKGHSIEARWAVVAAGFETAEPAARRVVRFKSTYVMLTEPVTTFEGWPERCLIWESDRPYVYLRTTSDNRILIGGEDEDFVNASKRDRLIVGKARRLHTKLRKRFPEIPTVQSSAWAGTFGETKDGLPYIGPLKPNSRVLYALCFGANGTNSAAIATEIIRATVLGRSCQHARLFGFDR